MRNIPATPHPIDTPGIGPKKTFFVLMTVVGCIAILWPKVFYPMMLGGGIPKQPAIKGHHGTVACCDVVLDRDNFLNISKTLGDQTYRKQIEYRIAQMSLRQERPPHLRKEGIHPAMLEKGRAIPSTQTVPVVSRPAKSQPIMVEGRPGPIPGLRPPLGAGAVHKAQPKSNSMSFIMPLYTIGIIAFFVYTIMKLLFKKQVANAPYGPARGDPNFRKDVFENDQLPINRPDDGTTKLGLIDAADEQMKRREADRNKDQPETTSSAPSNLANGHTKSETNGNLDMTTEDADSEKPKDASTDEIAKESNAELEAEAGAHKKDELEDDSSESKGHADTSKPDSSQKRTAQVLGMELTASCEGGLKWTRPPTPIFSHRPQSPIDGETEKPESIFLEGALPRESQILVSDAETRTENVVDDQLNGSSDEPAVVLSSKMTLSLINLNLHAGEESAEPAGTSTESDSPIGDDIEIINGAEKDSNDTDESEEKHESEKAKESHE